MPNDSEDANSDFINRYFVGSAFEDQMFNIDSNEREKACSWKIMRSPYFQALTNDSWRWRAIGIPLDLVDKSLKGDIDLLFATRIRSQERGKHAFSILYRCFELKTSKVARDGTVKSLKLGKFQKTQVQLEKLCNIGSPQTFLLEAFIVEAGYSGVSNGVMPTAVRDSVSKKYNQMMRAGYGYVTMALEQIEGYSEEDTGKLWPVANIKEAKTFEIGKSFRDIVLAIKNYIERIGGAGYSPVITYCYACRELTSVHARGPYICSGCGKPIL